jgi:EpsI family protein
MIRRCCLITVLLVTVWAIRVRVGSPALAPHGALSNFPAMSSTWQGKDVPLDPEIAAQTGANDQLNRIYRAGNSWLGLYVAYYANQKAGEAVHSPMNCLPGSGWQPIETGRIDVAARGGTRATINRVVVAKGLEQGLVLYWYQTPERVTASEYLSKAFLVRDAFRSGRTDVALVRITAPINANDPQGRANALRAALPFAEFVLPDLHRSLFQS